MQCGNLKPFTWYIDMEVYIEECGSPNNKYQQTMLCICDFANNNI